MAPIQPPYYPIIYVRGYAMTQGEIDATVATPYMGFNLGSTKTRQDWEGKTLRHIFESPLVRLMKDHGYQDIYLDGRERVAGIPARSIVIYRYYEPADSDLGGGEPLSVQAAAQGLEGLILKLREQVCGEDAAVRSAFRVYLVAHSMGGLVCRCFLQNPAVGSAATKALVDKVFTYATPHNGIEMAGMNVPAFLNLWDLNNFNREKMAAYLGLPEGTERVDSLHGTFPAERFFSLVGTNHRDYAVAAGLSSKLAGEMSDGLVKIENAAVAGSPRAFVHRCHSGPFGIVNSEEGYQNLVRFLFGNVRVAGTLEVDALPLPPSVRKALGQGKKVRSSYYFEATVSPRGAMTYRLTERRRETHSAVLRKYDELLRLDKVEGRETPRSPVLFSVFLDTARITRGRSLVFSLDLGVSTTGYEIDELLFFDRHVAGEYLYRNTLTLRATAGSEGWQVYYTPTDDAWSESRGRAVEEDARGRFVPLRSAKGFRGKLRLAVGSWACTGSGAAPGFRRRARGAAGRGRLPAAASHGPCCCWSPGWGRPPPPGRPSTARCWCCTPTTPGSPGPTRSRPGFRRSWGGGRTWNSTWSTWTPSGSPLRRCSLPCWPCTGRSSGAWPWTPCSPPTTTR
jgi:hypothetical protein